MASSLYLIETRAQRTYVCAGCSGRIPRSARHFRHDPHPGARMFRGELTTHWCWDCITSSLDDPQLRVAGHFRISTVRVPRRAGLDPDNQLLLFQPLKIKVIEIGQLLSRTIAKEPNLIYSLTPNEMEELICDRLSAMNFDVRRTGAVNRKDGGVDVLFWPRARGCFPFLGAAQVRHHSDSRQKEGSASVRDFAGAMAAHPFNVGLLITNTSFSPDAEWFAHQHAKLVRLRDLNDIRRWLLNNFDDESEWREIPDEIELCPGVVVKIR